MPSISFTSRGILPEVNVAFCLEQSERGGFLSFVSIQRTVTSVISTTLAWTFIQSTFSINLAAALLRFYPLMHMRALPSGDGKSSSTLLHLNYDG